MTRTAPAILGLLLLAACGGSGTGGPLPTLSAASALQVQSPAFADGGAIPSLYTCDGPDRSPPLAWTASPSAAAEYVVVVTDPDAPGGDFVHWVLFGIPGTVTNIAAGASPPGTREGENDFGHIGYDGPCPPSGSTHRYRFTVYAVTQVVTSGLPSGASAQEILGRIQTHCCLQATGTVTGVYRRA